MSEKKSDLAPRLITAAVAIPILLYIIFVAPKWGFFALLVWAGATSVWEYCSITYGDTNRGGKVATTIVGIGAFSTLYWSPESFIFALCGATIAIFLYFLFRYQDQKTVSHEIGASVTGLVYGAILVGTLALLNRDAGTAGPFWILLSLALVWISDTGAYFSGRAFGKRKLYEAVSPNKSVEGAIGGFLSTLAIAFGFNALFSLASDGVQTQLLGMSFLSVDLSWTPLTPVQVLILAIPANILAQIGDLAESLIKRAHGVKDSGTIVYGHGGILDRIDALIFAAPWVYYCFTMFSRTPA